MAIDLGLRFGLLAAALVVLALLAPSAWAGTVARTAWTVDLGSARQVRTVTIKWRGDANRRHRLRTSRDGRRYRTAARLGGHRGRVRVRLGRRAVRYVRVTGRTSRAPRVVVRARPRRAPARPRRAPARPRPRSRPRVPAAPSSPAPSPSPTPTPWPIPSPRSSAPWTTAVLPAPLGPSTGTPRYVSTTGSDANPGTIDRPWRSITKALKAAVPGDRILVRAGTYSGTLGAGPDAGGGVGPAVVASPKGTAAAPITLAAHPGERPVIAAMVSLPSPQWFRMTGLVVDGTNAPAGAEGVSLGNTSGAAPSHVEISYNEIRDFQPASSHAHGILHYSGTDTALVGNRIHHIGRQTFYDHGIYMKAGRRVVVANNVISDVTGGYGLHIWGDFDDSWVINNTVHGSAASGFTIGGNSARGKPDRVVAANNILAGHTGTADSHQGYAAKEYQPGTGNSVRNNLGWGNARSTPFYLSASGPANNRTLDPGFAGGTLAVGHGGAAVDSGESFGLLLDAAGRPRDGRPDIGAYEAP